ncbi:MULTISPECIES: type I polyketide synthase [unclassified Bradyrhizobium]|uniref:type I polyketide synthase n=1 Tax=unclassified Bradyrhizobium TaxID=2631580 RepID=UPI002916F338|nr:MULTISPECIES: SDR family NAD(P)-dependent oxidoreductase [unclassified Bradyrhizobium]
MQHDMCDLPNSAVAIIGMWGRFPGASTLTEYWQLLSAGKSSISMNSVESLLAEGLPANLVNDPDFVPAKGVLADATLFAHQHFGYSLSEAAHMDPQQRHFLECCWAALEDAGYDPTDIEGLVGVYGGSRLSTYGYARFAANPDMLVVNDVSFLISNDKDYLTTRVSHKLGLRGPSVNVQSACSTSLTAVAMAVNALRDGEVGMALAGGVKISVPLNSGYLFSPDGILSPDGRCRAFDAAAAGTVFGDGVGVVVLKRLEDAIRDRDPVRAVIRGTAINNDGADRASYAAPSVRGQAEVIASAIESSGVQADSITYLECHGTGTRLGDAIELEAARRAFGEFTNSKEFCAIGSVKPNIGHLSQAAGVASLIKVILAMEHRQLPPSINIEVENPDLHLTGSPFYLNRRLTPWLGAAGVLRAGISSFGMGGTNVHLIVEQAPPRPVSTQVVSHVLVPLSGESQAALDRTAHTIEESLVKLPPADLLDAGYTLASGRGRQSCRQALLIDSATRVSLRISEHHDVRVSPDRIAFVFPGVGAEAPAAGRELYASDVDFRSEIDSVLPILSEHFGESARDLLFPTDAKGSERLSALIAEPHYSQPILLVHEYALAKSLMAKGLRPDLVTGHSLGEYVAACIAGVFSFPDAVRIVAARGRLVSKTPPGGMIVVFETAEIAKTTFGSRFDVAVIGGPDNCVLSGEREDIDRLEEQLRHDNVPHMRLPTMRAYHSRLFDSILKEFGSVVESTPRSSPKLHILSCMTGKVLSDDEALSTQYWVDHLRQPVRFDLVLEALESPEGCMAIEVGFRSVLGSQLKNRRRLIALELRALNGELRGLHHLLARAWCAGANVDWNKYFDGDRRQSIHMPPSSFDRVRCWAIENNPRLDSAVAKTPRVVPAIHHAVWKSQKPQLSDARGDLKNVLVLADPSPVLSEIVGHLSRRATWISQDSGGRWAADVARKPFPDLPSLLGALQKTNAEPIDAVIWAMDFKRGGPIGLDDERLGPLAISRFHAFRDLLGCLQAQSQHNVQLTVLTNGGLSLPQDEKPGALDPNVVMQGAIGAVALEYDNVACRFCDVRLSQDGDLANADLKLLLELLKTPSHGETSAIRNGSYWSQGHSRSAGEALHKQRVEGCWLIAGGAGGIGAAIAEALAEAGASQLVLAGRTQCPPRELWEDVLASPDTDPRVVEIIRNRQQIEAAGAVVAYEVCDVANTRDVEMLARRWPNVHGLVHSAGIPSGGLLAGRNASDISAVMEPKILGAINLMRSFGRNSLKHYVLCSSMNAIRPRFGQLDYCSANAFLDALAAAAPDVRTVSINWDVWGTVGMALKLQPDEALHPWRARTIAEGILVEEGKAAFLSALGLSYSNLAVTSRSMTESAGSLFASEERERMSSALRELAQSKPARERKVTTTVNERPIGSVEKQIAEIWSDMLGEPEIGRNTSFFELGGHSLVAVSILSRLRRAFGAHIPLRDFLENPTIAATAAALQTALEPSPTSSIPKAPQRIALVLREHSIDGS